MSSPIKNTTPPTSPTYDEFEYDPAVDDAYLSDMAEDYGISLVQEDQYVGGAEGESPMGYSAYELRNRMRQLRGLLAHSDLSTSEKNKILLKFQEIEGRLNYAQALNPDRNALELSGLQSELAGVEARIMGISTPAGVGDELGGETGMGVPSLDELEKQLKDFKNKVKSEMENLTDKEKEDALVQIDKWLTEIKMGESNPAEFDAQEIQIGLEEMQTQLEESNSHAPELKGLAEATGLDMSVIETKAENHNPPIDLKNPTMNADLIDFLCELSPSLKEQFENVASATNAMWTEYEKQKNKAADINSLNKQGTTDETDIARGVMPFQAIYDLKYGQHDLSKKVVSAMEAALKELQPMLQALFKDEVEPVEAESGVGWRRDYNKFKVAGQISIGSQVYDLFNNGTGEVDINTTPDTFDLKIVRVEFDNEGTGQWNPMDYLDNIYDEPGYDISQGYDPDYG